MKRKLISIYPPGGGGVGVGGVSGGVGGHCFSVVLPRAKEPILSPGKVCHG